VFVDILAKNPDLKVGAGVPVDYFLPMNGYSEDISFCLRAKKAGHQPHVDLGVPVKHIGYKTY
jgi:hypothetical protein